MNPHKQTNKIPDIHRDCLNAFNIILQPTYGHSKNINYQISQDHCPVDEAEAEKQLNLRVDKISIQDNNFKSELKYLIQNVQQLTQHLKLSSKSIANIISSQLQGCIRDSFLTLCCAYDIQTASQRLLLHYSPATTKGQELKDFFQYRIRHSHIIKDSYYILQLGLTAFDQLSSAEVENNCLMHILGQMEYQYIDKACTFYEKRDAFMKQGIEVDELSFETIIHAVANSARETTGITKQAYIPSELDEGVSKLATPGLELAQTNFTSDKLDHMATKFQCNTPTTWQNNQHNQQQYHASQSVLDAQPTRNIPKMIYPTRQHLSAYSNHITPPPGWEFNREFSSHSQQHLMLTVP